MSFKYYLCELSYTMIKQLHSQNYNLCGVFFDITIIKTNLTNDPLFVFGDFQECSSTNKIIFDFTFEILNDLGYDVTNYNSICSGDMYGETYFNNKGERIIIKGANGVPNYSLYNRTKTFFYVLGNHDKILVNTNDKIISLGDINSTVKLNNGTTIVGINDIYSTRNPKYLSQVINKLKLKPDILVTHDSIKTNELFNLVKNKVKIHIFGHFHMKNPWKLSENTLFLNSDSRFFLVLPN